MTSPASSHGAVQQAAVTIAHAQILTLPTSPVVVVAAPGAGRMVVPLFGAYYLNPLTVSYTNLAGSIQLVLDATNNYNQMSGGALASGFMTEFSSLPSAAVDPGANLTGAGGTAGAIGRAANGFDNAALYVASSSGSGNFTGGTAGQSLHVTVAYVVVTL